MVAVLVLMVMLGVVLMVFAKMEKMDERIGESDRDGDAEAGVAAHFDDIRDQVEDADAKERAGSEKKEHAGARARAAENERQAADGRHTDR